MRWSHLQDVGHAHVVLCGQQEALGVAEQGVRGIHGGPALQGNPLSRELVQHPVLVGRPYGQRVRVGPDCQGCACSATTFRRSAASVALHGKIQGGQLDWWVHGLQWISRLPS